MFRNKRILFGLFTGLIIGFSIIGFVVALKSNIVSYTVNTSGTIQMYTEHGQTPLLAPGERWTALDFGEGKIKQVTINVATEGWVYVVVYSNGNTIQNYKICDSEVFTFSCDKIDFQSPAEFGYEKIVFYDYIFNE